MGENFERGASTDVTRSWPDVHRRLAATPLGDLDATELEELAVAAYLLGDDDGTVSAWEAAFARHLDAGDRAEAARCAFWLALCRMLRGQMAHAGAWLGRSQETIGADLDCTAAGYLKIPALLQALDAHDPGRSRDLALQARAIADRFGDGDLRAFATLGHGQSLLALGDTALGLAELDAVMLSVSRDEVGPITSGIAYCAVILECMQLLDLARAAEWTDALETWCDAQAGLVPYRGQCLVHRSQLLQMAGDWPRAIATVESARDRLTDPPHPALGLAHYQMAELHRLMGAFDAAVEAYGRASRVGHQPMPGLALLELARGELQGAVASIRRALAETPQSSQRPGLLSAAVDIFREAQEPDAARAAADELAALAGEDASDVLAAMSDHATGAVELEEDPGAALGHLRTAVAAWQRLRMPYEAARTTVLIGLACAAMGDRASAAMELDGACAAFAQLGAQPDLERARAVRSGLAVEPGERARSAQSASGLSAREVEVLRHVAEGKTNREIASALTLSQHTVSRHLENIFAKLGVTTRAAATAYAYEHDLLGG